MTPKQLSAWVAAVTPILGLIGYGGYTQVEGVKQQYVTHQQATAGHLGLTIKMLKAELRYMDSRELTRHEELYYAQLLEVLAATEVKRNEALGIP